MGGRADSIVAPVQHKQNCGISIQEDLSEAIELARPVQYYFIHY